MAARRFPVEAGHVLMFARSLGAADPEGGLPAPGDPAPPTFTSASAQFDPDYPLRWRPGKPWFGSGKTASGVEERASGGGGLHAEQHFEYARPVRPGDVLTWTTRPGKTWEKQGRRGGRLVFSEMVTEYRDQDGELVVTARSVGVRTEKPVEEGK